MLGATALAGYYAGFAPSSQLFGSFPYRGATHERTVALTFDDGPNEPYTSRLLDLLASRAVRATFFQVGRCAERWPGLSRQMHEAGHVVGNHSYSHRFSRSVTQPSLSREIARAQDTLGAEVGRVPALFRPPWLFHPPPLLSEVRRMGMQVVSGTFAHPCEVAQPSSRRIANRAVSLAKPGSILIFHDGFDARGGDRSQTLAAVEQVLDELAGRGFSFTTVDQILRVPAYL
jgi:peptidoglycan/xylan/chitin deacetylase (PgdA/CDA1 family)